MTVDVRAERVRERGASRSAMRLRVDVISSIGQLEQLRESWDEVLARCADRNLFMSYEWTVAWWRHFGETNALRVFLVKDGCRLLAIAPMMVRKTWYGGLPVRMLGFLSNQHASRSNFIIAERHDAVFSALAGQWREHAHEWDVLRLTQMPSAAGLTHPLCEAARRAGLKLFGPEELSRIRYLDVADGFDDYYKSRSRKFRANIRNAANLLKNAGTFSYDVFNTAERIDAGLREFFALDLSSRKAGRKFAVYDDSEKAFCHALANALVTQHGYEVRLLRLNDRYIAGLFSLQFECTFYFMVTYFDESYERLDPGRNLFWNTISTHWDPRLTTRIDFNGNARYLSGYSTGTEIFEVVSVCNGRAYSNCLSILKSLKRGVQTLRAGQR